jgi:hypothetical protein
MASQSLRIATIGSTAAGRCAGMHAQRAWMHRPPRLEPVILQEALDASRVKTGLQAKVLSATKCCFYPLIRSRSRYRTR